MRDVSPESAADTCFDISESTHSAETLTKSQRLRKPREFREAYAQGNKVVGRYMVLWRRQADDASLRLGVVASKKVGNAVKRSRAKRLLREAFRRNRWRFCGSDDVVLVGRRAILSASWDAIVNELLHLAGKSGILSEKG